jgi:hypothetical protein
MSTHSFYFKTVYTCQTINYDIDLNMSITEFINYVKGKIRVDFDIDNNYSIEIVEAGQFNNENGRDAELAPALEYSNTSIREKFNNYKQTAFYIRPVMRRRLSLERPNTENVNENENDDYPRAPR